MSTGVASGRRTEQAGRVQSIEPRLPTEPAPSPWEFPDLRALPAGGDLIAVGADLRPGSLLGAYRAGLFPMPEGRSVGWWSPDPRGIIPLDGVHVSRSLRRALRRFTVSRDRCFDEIIRRCADPRRAHGWISPAIIAAYRELHRLGWATSIEVWNGDELVGGLYGVRIGGLFAGESMFHAETDASKVAVVRTVEWLGASGATLFDVQWTTPHLRTLGAVDVSRAEYLDRLAAALGVRTRDSEQGRHDDDEG